MNALFLGTGEDKSYLPYLKGMFNGLSTFINLQPVNTLTELVMYCEQRDRKISRVVSTNTILLSKLLALKGTVKTNPSLDNYAGSMFSYRGIDIVFVSPLSQLFTVPYGKFICERFISKVTAASSWNEATIFSFSILNTGSDYEHWYQIFQTAYAIAIDIETFSNPVSIRCISYTGVFISASNCITTESIVFPLNSSFALAWLRKFNELPAQKIFQNGKYDNSYLLRYNAPPTNWLWDTQHFFHSWYSELPKDLAFLNAFFLRKVVYWKDLAETRDLEEYYKYNAMDSWATANVWIQQLISAPDWARRNYTLEFPLVYPCLLAEMTGVLRDAKKLIEARNEADLAIKTKTDSLRKMVGSSSFNANSPKQVVTLLKILGHKDITSSGEKELQKASYLHPLSARILETILEIRGHRKLVSTYLRSEEDAKQTGIHAGEGGAKEFAGTILYALNPHGTDTGRLASREHHFWCGLQIQNIPRGKEVKQTIMSADGFFFGECDLEQAESRDTAYISGDERLIAAVSGTRDFHSVNASAFFGKSYESIYSDTARKTLDKKLRDLSKRVNHGANYNMGPGVLVATMGLKNIYEAARLLGLKLSNPLEIAAYLLEQFHKTYPRIRGHKTPYTEGTYYAWVAREISIHTKLVSRAYHHTEYNVKNYSDFSTYIEQGDWTRYCFGKPDKNKSDLNAYVAHVPQSLNARTLNEAFMKVFYEIALGNPNHFRLHAQIHDSILFSISASQTGKDIANRVKQCMEIPVSLRDISGRIQNFTVPSALKLGASGEGAKYWSDIE
jgi:DNA polymerase I-like protein with 3'-5' exonuclease and polymerase domains